MLNRVNVGIRLSLAFGLLLLVLIVSVALALGRLHTLKSGMDVVVHENNARTDAASDMRGSLNITSRSVRNLLIYKTVEDREIHKERIAGARRDYDEAFARLEKLARSDEERRLLANIEDAATKARPLFNEATALALSGQEGAGAEFLRTQVQAEQDRWFANIDSMIDLQDRQSVALANALQQEYDVSRQIFYFLVVLGLSLGGVLAVLITRSVVVPLTRAVTVARELAAGDLGARIEVDSQDETGVLLLAMRDTVGALERLAAGADAIAQGDFSQDVPLASERDRLARAINNMTAMLRAAKQESEQRYWVKDGFGQLSMAMVGDLALQQQADTVLSILGRYLAAGRGVIYIARTEEGVLELLSSYMYSERAHLGNRFRLGEGAIGQVAREKKPIILTTVDADSPPILTGTSCVTPLYTYTYPLLRDNTLLGVVELASAERYNATQLEFLSGAAELIASVIYVAEQREKIAELLAVAEASANEARAHSLRLQEANALMEEQQQQLQQQSEELRQSNTQMEEQQHRLQQQTEELQQSNAQMEEQQQQLQQQTEELRQANVQMAVQQKQLEESNTELLHSREEIDAKARLLEQSSQYKSEFLANMSHELRTPLNSIILLSKMMVENLDGRLGAEEIKRAEVIHHSGENLLHLINDVLDLSKVEAGRMDIQWARVSSERLAEEAHDLFELTAHERGLAFVIDDRLQGSFVSDADKIGQVLRNLLSNAFKFTKAGTVTLRLLRSEDQTYPIRIEVIDTGIGIPEDKRTHVFEAFRQVDGTISRQYGGTGLGLTISLRLAQLLGGTLDLQSTPGEGSRFALCLPEAPAASEGVDGAAAEARHGAMGAARQSDESARRRTGLGAERGTEAGVEGGVEEGVEEGVEKGVDVGSGRSGSEPTGSGAPSGAVRDDRERLLAGDQSILLIDDDPQFCMAVMEINRPLGYKTLIAHGGQDGLALVRQYRPSGILLDLGLPDMDGTEVLHKLKTSLDLKHIPVYVISARDRNPELLRQGAAGYMQKPVDSGQIASAEADMLGAELRSAGGGDVLILGSGGIAAEDVARLVGPKATPKFAPLADVATPAALAAALTAQPWRLVLVDLSGRPVDDALALAAQVREASPTTGFLFFSAVAVSAEDEARLRAYSESIIIKTAYAEQRLLQNIERFLNEVPLRANPLPASLPPPAESTEKRLAGCRVLVVDDDPRNLFVITAALEQNGAVVSNAINGRHAIETLEKAGEGEGAAVDLVLMDIMMPEMDGYQAIAALRAKPAFAELPIIALSAKALPQDRDKALAAGADDYLVKPVDYGVLLSMVARYRKEKAG